MAASQKEWGPCSHQSLLQDHLARIGVTDTRGVELMHLVKTLANTYETIMAERLRSEQLSAPRWRLLLRLFFEEQQGKPSLSPTALSRSQSVSKNTISAHLRSLEEQGWISRELDPADRRSFRIRLTEAGRTLVRETAPVHVDFLNQLAGDLSPAETGQLRALLCKLHGSLVSRGVAGQATARSQVHTEQSGETL